MIISIDITIPLRIFSIIFVGFSVFGLSILVFLAILGVKSLREKLGVDLIGCKHCKKRKMPNPKSRQEIFEILKEIKEGLIF